MSVAAIDFSSIEHSQSAFSARTAENQVDPLFKGVQKITSGAVAVKNDTGAFSSVLQTGWYGLMAVEAARGASMPVTLAMQKIAGSVTVIDLFDVCSSANYFISGAVVEDAKKKQVCKITGTALLALGGISGAFMILSDLGFFKLGSLAMKIGTGVTAGIFGLGHLFMAGHAIRQIVVAKNGPQLAKGILDLISKIAEIALCILIVVPGVNVAAIIVLGLVAKGLAVVSFFVEYYNPEAFAEESAPAG